MQSEMTLTVDITEHADDHLFVAVVRELQGCVASGRDHDELQRNLRSAIADYLEIFENATLIEVGPLVDAVVAAEPSHVKVLAGAC